MDPFSQLKCEYVGIAGTIERYTSSVKVKNWLDGLNVALEQNDKEKILYYLENICNWYNESIQDIKTNDFVLNKPEHVENMKLVNNLYKELKEYDFPNSRFLQSDLNNSHIVEGDHNKEAFIVYGHDEGLKEKCARLLEQQDIKAIILSEQAGGGRTIIEKFEEYANCRVAIALFTKDDIVESESKEHDKKRSYRARQNVVFETGYCMAKFGRRNVIVISEDGIEMPSDLNGVSYINKNEWQLEVLKELEKIGFSINANKLTNGD